MPSRLKTKEEIIDFFHEYIFGFIFNDIQNCIKATADYTVALALLSYTEFLGGLINGKLGLEKWSKKNFGKALDYFPKQYKSLKNIKIEYYVNKKRQEKMGLYEIFRYGLAHEYFIKGGRKISCVWNNPNGYTADHIGVKKKKAS